MGRIIKFRTQQHLETARHLRKLSPKNRKHVAAQMKTRRNRSGIGTQAIANMHRTGGLFG